MGDEAAPNLPDVSDLKTFDVPDPERSRGSKLMTYGIAVAGVVAACIAMNAIATDHWFAVLSNPAETERNRDRAHRWIEDLPREEAVPRILALPDLAVRGSFYAILGETGDPVHLPAVAAYLQSVADDPDEYYDQGWYAEEVCKHIGAYPPEQVGPMLVRAWTGGTEKMRPPLLEAIVKMPPDTVLPGILAIADDAARGQFHAVLAHSGDPNQIDAIVAYVAAESASTTRRFEAEAASLVAFGEAGTARLEAALQRSERPVINLAAEALRAVNLPFLTLHCRAKLADYAKGMYGEGGLVWAFEVNKAWEELAQLPVAERLKSKLKAADYKRAREILSDFETRSYRILEMLKAMGPVTENEEVDFCFIHGLSSFSKPVAEHCAHALRERLSLEQLVDVLFRFIAKKSQFEVREVNVYDEMLRATGDRGAVRIGENLQRLLADAEGDLSAVFWIYKYLGLAALAEIGTAAQLPILEKYAADTESFVRTRRMSDGTSQETEIKYRDEAEKAIAAIKQRGGE